MVHAFAPPSFIPSAASTRTAIMSSALHSSMRSTDPPDLIHKKYDDDDEQLMKQDIEALKQEAASRLDSLLQQMEELKQLNRNYSSNQKIAEAQPFPESPPQPSSAVAPAAVAETKTDRETSSSSSSPSPTTLISSVSITEQPLNYEIVHAPTAWLDETVWKIVFNIGREPGTWFPLPWGKSGDRVLFQCTVDFTGIPSSTLHDEFFHQTSNDDDDDGIRQLAVTDAFVIPRGVGAHSVGRRPLPVQPLGAYKVCRGQGPGGTDIVRLFIELTDTVGVPDHDSDVYCPAGRVYGTCGYFAIPQHHAANATSYRDVMQQQHVAAVREYERLQHTAALEESNRLSLAHWQTKQKIWKAQQRMEQTLQQYNLAKQQEPEKSQLRLSKAGNIGLSREGGVCVKVHKGLALEYHILGRMEVGCVQDHHGSPASQSVSSSSSQPQPLP